ncbi:putative membrane protein [Streptomyces glaucescens]
MTDETAEVGPIDYLVVEFPGNRMTGEGFPILVDLVDRGLIRILDLTFVRKDEDGSVTGMEIADLTGDGALDLAVFEGASSGLLGQDDLEEAASVLEPGSSAGVLIYENVWAAPFAAALRRGGARLVASGRIPVSDLLAALDATEGAEAAQ